MNQDSKADIGRLEALARLVRYYSLNMTSTAHSGHLTSSLSAADLMTGLMFGGTFGSTCPIRTIPTSTD